MPAGRKFGHIVSSETRAKISKSLQGRSYTEQGREPMSVEARAKSSASNMGKNLGKTHVVSPEARAKIGTGNKGKRRAKEETQRTVYARTHASLRRLFPYSGKCERCFAEGRTEWAFKYHPDDYTENRDDYFEFCVQCHRKHDSDERMIALRYWADAGRPIPKS